MHGGRYVTPVDMAPDFMSPCLSRNGVPGAERLLRRELPGAYTEEALRFIEENGDRPFFLRLSYNLPHLPHDLPDEFRGVSPRGPYGDAV